MSLFKVGDRVRLKAEAPTVDKLATLKEYLRHTIQGVSYFVVETSKELSEGAEAVCISVDGGYNMYLNVDYFELVPKETDWDAFIYYCNTGSFPTDA